MPAFILPVQSILLRNIPAWLAGKNQLLHQLLAKITVYFALYIILHILELFRPGRMGGADKQLLELKLHRPGVGGNIPAHQLLPAVYHQMLLELLADFHCFEGLDKNIPYAFQLAVSLSRLLRHSLHLQHFLLPRGNTFPRSACQNTPHQWQ